LGYLPGTKPVLQVTACGAIGVVVRLHYLGWTARRVAVTDQSWHRRARRSRQLARGLLALAKARHTVSRHHGGGGRAQMPLVACTVPQCKYAWNAPSSKLCCKCGGALNLRPVPPWWSASGTSAAPRGKGTDKGAAKGASAKGKGRGKGSAALPEEPMGARWNRRAAACAEASRQG
jgi:hypothetical protein